MKILFITYLALLGILSANAQAQTADPADYLSEEMKEGQAGFERALRKFSSLPEDQKKEVIEAISVRINTLASKRYTADTFDERAGYTKKAGYVEGADYIRAVGTILLRIGTDEQIINAFGSLSNFGIVEPDAAEVLASCKGTGGVEIIQKLAEKRLPELESAIISAGDTKKNDEERSRSDDILIAFYFLILRLDGATNPEGPRAAKRLRDQVAERYVSENGKTVVAMMDADMEKERSRKKKDLSNQEPAPSKTNSDSANAPKTNRPNAHKQVQPQSQERLDIPAQYKVAAMIAIILAGIAIVWRFMRKPKL